MLHYNNNPGLHVSLDLEAAFTWRRVSTHYEAAILTWSGIVVKFCRRAGGWPPPFVRGTTVK